MDPLPPLDLSVYLQDDRYARHLGIVLLEARPGYARARLTLQPEHLNSVGTAHGGAIFSLADLAFAAASNAYGVVAVGINVSISYLKAAREGILLAEAREVSCSQRLASYTVHVTDETGDIIAIFQGMVYRKRETRDDVRPNSASLNDQEAP
ncbi:MAG: PaaI family thioesterase [Anaerolineae bacterium]